MITHENKSDWKETFFGLIKSRPFIQLIVATLIMIICVVYSGIALLWTDYRRPMSGALKQDALHKAFPFIDAHILINVLMIIQMVVAVGCFVADQRRLIIIKRFMILYAILLTMRDISMTVTSLPDPSFLCPSEKPKELVVTPYSIFKALTGGLTCGDMIFSGHLLAYLLPTCLHTHFFGNWISIIMWLCSLFAAYLIIASHFHYSVDTILCLIIVPLINWIYHLVAENESEFSDIPAPLAWFFKKMEWSDGFVPIEMVQRYIF